MHRYRTPRRWAKVLLTFCLAAAIMAGPLAPAAFAYDTFGTVTSVEQPNASGRNVTYYDIYNGQSANRPDTSDEVNFYMDVISQQDNLLHWVNLGYVIHESNPKSYWDHAGDGWDKDFGSHYINYIDDMLTPRTKTGDLGVKATGLSVANSLRDVQQRAANDIADLIDRKLDGNDFMKRHEMNDALTETNQTVIYSTVSTTDRYGKTPQFGYNSFTVAFYDFRLHTLDDGKELNTVAGDATLEEAAASDLPGFSYSSGTTDGGMIALNQNNSIDEATVTLTLNDTLSETTSSSITNSEEYTFGESVGAELDLQFKMNLIDSEFDMCKSLSYGQALSTAYGEEDSITQSQDKSSSVTMSLPPHTIAAAQQTNSKTTLTTAYDCPVSLTYKVAIFSMCGTVYDDNMLVQSFSTAGYEQRSFISIFGNDYDNSDAMENLYQRAIWNVDNPSYDQTYGYTKGLKHSGSDWADHLDWDTILSKESISSANYKDRLLTGNKLVETISANYPMSITGGSFTFLQEGINTTLTSPVPMYPIRYIYIDYQLNRDFELEVGESLPIYSYRVQAYDQDMVPYYGFVSSQGEWKIVDQNGNPIESDVAKITVDSVTHQQRIEAMGEGTVYAKYFIPENTYTDYYGHVSTNADIDSPAYKVIVSAPEEAEFNGSIRLKGSVTAYVGGEPINLNAVDGLTAIAYDTTGREVEVPLSWESQELESRGIQVTEDGVLTVTQPGTFHVRAYCQDVYSNWVEVTAQEKEDLLISQEEPVISTTSNIPSEIAYEPTTMMNRGDFVLLLHKLASSPENGNINPVFHDVDLNSEYGKALDWAKSKGIVSGHGNGYFNPEDGLDRQQMATILFNLENQFGEPISLSEEEIAAELVKYTDGDQVSAWAKEAVVYALQNGYLQPDADQNINSTDYVSKSNAARAMVEIAKATGLM